MGRITDLNIAGLEPGKHAAQLGDAHQLITAGILIRLGFDVALVFIKGGAYDLWVMGYKEPGGERVPLRVQVRTLSKGRSIRFIAGIRAGVDRKYFPGVKEYKYTERDNDLLIGVDRETLDLYLIPTRYISRWGKSKSIRGLQPLKNRWDVLLNWNDEFLGNLEKQLG